MKKKMHQTFHNEWRRQTLGVDKLRTYVHYKSQYCTETYVLLITNRQHRSILAQSHCGILPLKIDTGRYQNITPEFRLCTFGNENTTETKIHFLLYCSYYTNVRQEFLTASNITNFHEYTDDEKKSVILISETRQKHCCIFV